jgi:hypothetical protein
MPDIHLSIYGGHKSMEQEKYNPFGSPVNKVGRGSSTERDRAEHESPLKQPSTSARLIRRNQRKRSRPR